MMKRAGSATMRRVLVVGLACALAGAATAQDAPTRTPAPGTRVILDTFDDVGTGWTQHASNGGLELAYRDGTYQAVMTTPTPLQMIESSVRFADGVVSVDVGDLAPTGPHPQGLFVRGQDLDNYYGYLIQSDGTFTIFLWQNGRYVEVSGANAALPAGLYNSDGLNAMDVITEGPILRFFLNYTEIFSLPDAKWNDGTAGLLVGNLSFDPAGTVFDNWRVEIAR